MNFIQTFIMTTESRFETYSFDLCSTLHNCMLQIKNSQNAERLNIVYNSLILNEDLSRKLNRQFRIYHINTTPLHVETLNVENRIDICQYNSFYSIFVKEADNIKHFMIEYLPILLEYDNVNVICTKMTKILKLTYKHLNATSKLCATDDRIDMHICTLFKSNSE